MSSVRQSIEWNYGACGNMWSYMNFKKGLRLKENNVAMNSLACIIIHNAWVTMNHGITSNFFACDPPAFEDWVSAGPRAAVVVPSLD